jgi:hypothetical protein
MTIAGIDVTATAAVDAADVAAAFATVADAAPANVTAGLTLAGTLTDWDSAAAVGTAVTFTSTTALDVVADIEIAKAISETNNPGITALLAVARAQLDAAADTADATAADDKADVALETADAGGVLSGAVLAAEAALKAADKAEAALEKAYGAWIDGATNFLTLAALNKALAAAEAKVEGLDTIDTATFTATDDDDILLVDETSSVVADFLEDGDDVIYLGDAYTVNAGTLEDGDDAVLEVFFNDKSKTDDTVVITIETEAFGSSSTSDFFTIELTGLTTDDITFDSGLITAA